MKAHLLTAVLIIGTIGLGLKSTSTMAQTIIYVKADGTGDGTSWANACSMDDAIDVANTGSAFASDIQIWVMKGTYTPSEMLTIPASVKMFLKTVILLQIRRSLTDKRNLVLLCV